MNGGGEEPLSLKERLVWWSVIPAIRVVARVAWRWTIDVRDDFPQPPLVIAANHHSFLDPPLIGAAYGRRIRFVGLVDLFGRSRLVDWTLDTLEVIRVRRGTVPLSAMRQALSHLASGGALCLFPEGTRVHRFGDADPLPGAAWLAVRAKVPLVAVAVIGTDRVLGIDNKFHRGRVKTIIGPTLHPLGEGREAVDDLTRRWQDWIASVV